MIIVQDVLDLAIETEMNCLAHRVFWAVSEGKAKASESSTVLDRITYDEEAITKMIETNRLEIGKVKLFVAITKIQIFLRFTTVRM